MQIIENNHNFNKSPFKNSKDNERVMLNNISSKNQVKNINSKTIPIQNKFLNIIRQN